MRNRIIVSAINNVLGNRDEFIKILSENIKTIINEDNDKKLNDIDKRLEELQKEILQLAISKVDYNKIADEIYRLRDIKQNVLSEKAERQGKSERIREMEKFLYEHDCLMKEYDDSLVRKLIEKVTVYQEKLEIEFKSGVKIEMTI